MSSTSGNLSHLLVKGAALLLAVALLVISVRDARRYPGIDLRTKVAGARLLLANHDPYPPPNQPNANERFRMFNDNTYSPFLLAAYVPLSSLPYGVQRVGYVVLDWICILFLFVQTRAWFPKPKRDWHTALFALLVLADCGVRLHMERGQYYLPLAALIAWAISDWKQQRGTGWGGAIVLGVLILLRPTFLITLPILLLLRLRTVAWKSTLMACLLLTAMVALFGVQPWISYVHTVSALQQRTLLTDFDGTPNAQTAQQHSGPKMAEGFDFGRSLHTNYAVSRVFVSNLSQGRVLPLTRKIFKSATRLSQVNSTLLLLSVLYCLALAYALRAGSQEHKLAFVFLAPLMIETFGPQRNAYCDVLLVPTLLLVSASAITRGKLQQGVKSGIAVGCGLCIVAYISAVTLPPAGPLIEAASLARWYGLLILANLFFVRESFQFRRSAPSAIIATM